MYNYRQIFEHSLEKKGVPASKLIDDLGFNQATYYNWLRKNSLPSAELEKICNYLEIDFLIGESTIKKYANEVQDTNYWTEFINQLSKDLTMVKMENWTLKKELGKFEVLLFA